MDGNKEKIKKFASGRYSFNDYLSVSSYFKDESHDEWLKKQLGNDWDETGPDVHDGNNLSHLLDRLHHKINLKSNQQSTFSKVHQVFSRVAAVLLIPALITIVVLAYLTIDPAGLGRSKAWAEIHSPIGTRTKFELPDGTQGWLNSGSSIKYPVNFHARRVEILGEAWLDVVHQESNNFQVSTPYFDLEVLGTQFNVTAYDNEETAEVILERGKVRVLGKEVKFETELTPDQSLVYNKLTNKVSTASIDSKSYTSWKDGLLIFKNVPMTEIARRLERQYSAEIILHGDSLKSSIFRATFQDENLEEICKMLATVAPIEYVIHKREKKPDNTFTKSKVEMWLKN